MLEGKKPKKITDLSKLAKGQLIGNYPAAILTSLTFVLIEFTLTLFSAGNSSTITQSGYLMSLLITVILDLLFGVLVYGQSSYFLKLSRGEKAAVSDLFSGFKGLFDKSILVQTVFTAFSCLGLIPSILYQFGLILIPEEYLLIFSYAAILFPYLINFLAKLYFGLSFYILIDNPEWNVTSIFKESLYLMKKQKGRLLLTYLSALPIMLLSFLSCGIGIFWFYPYFQTLLANFYLDCKSEEGWSLNNVNSDDPSNPGSQNPTDSSTLDIRL